MSPDKSMEEKLKGVSRDWNDGMICPYCGNKAEWVSNEEVYGRRFGEKSHMMYICRPCDARVGCHQNSKKPFGTMANAQLRAWRMRVHREIDYLWKSGKMSRKTMYLKLNEMLGHEVHVGWSDIDECERILEAAAKIRTS